MSKTVEKYRSQFRVPLNLYFLFLRVQNRDKLVGIISDRLKEESNEAWVLRFEGSSFAYGPVNSLDQVFADKQVLHNDMLKQVNHSTLGTISQVN